MRNKLAVKSSVIGLFARLLSIIIGLICSRVFALYLGAECLGINGVFSNVLGFLQLAELGIGTAITYALYKPLVCGDIREIKILMQFYKKIYRRVFYIIMFIGILIIPLVLSLVEGVSYSKEYIVLAYLANLATTGVTYLLAYKRDLLYADQKQYVFVLIDAIVNVVFCFLRIFTMIYTRSFICCILLSFIQYFVSNLVVSIYCDSKYPFLKDIVDEKYDKIDDFNKNLKNIFIGKIGAWVYNSTDNLIISKFAGIVMVGLLSNYYLIKLTLQTILSSITAPIQPMIGNYIREKDDMAQIFDVFKTYTFIRYFIANIVTIGFIVMGNDVMKLWLGSDFVVGQSFVNLLAIDMYIGIVHGPLNDFIQVLGLFKNDKNMSLFGMMINLILSIFFVNIYGPIGVLIGTAIAQCYYWIARAVILFKLYFKKESWKYIFTMFFYILNTIVIICGLEILFEQINIPAENIGGLCIKGMICVLVTTIITLFINCRSQELKRTIRILKSVLSGNDIEEKTIREENE